MAIRICTNGHRFEKSSDCPVCPKCSSTDMKNKFSEEFPTLGAPAYRALGNIGITNLRDLTKHTEQELLSLHGFGPKALRLLRDGLREKGLSFARK